MSNILRITVRELRDRKWSLLAYSIGSLAMIWIYVATFRSSQTSVQQLQDLVKAYPKGLQDALGLNSLSLTTIEGYLNSKHFSLIWPLLAIILALSRAGSQIAGEIQSGTMGLLLNLPLERWRVFAAKYLMGVVTIFVFTAISVFGVIPFAAAYGIPFHLNILVSAWILTTLFMLSVYSFGMAASSWFSDRSKTYAVTATVLIIMYAAHIISLISNNLADLKYVSIFHYFNTQEVLSSGHIMVSSLIVFSASIILTTLFAIWRFNSRDISI